MCSGKVMDLKKPKKPWDILATQFVVGKIARFKFIKPNHITFFRLIFASSSIFMLSQAEFICGSFLFAIANLMDHLDGELARFTQTKSEFGHWFDLATDGFTIVGFFIALGYGFSETLGILPIISGFISGITILLIFLIRNKIEQAHGKTGVKQKSFYGFESEDILYIAPLLALTDTLIYFLYLSSIGSPIGVIITYLSYRKL